VRPARRRAARVGALLQERPAFCNSRGKGEGVTPAWPASLVLKADKVTAVRGYRILFENLSVRVRGGEILELRGPNGAGKSTLLRILAGLTRQAAGEIHLEGVERETAIAYLGHLDAVKPNETARMQARFWATFAGQPAEAAEAALAAVGLASRADVPGRGLSAGQKRRLALSRLLIDPRPVWLLDEPVASLDAGGRAMVEAMIARHAASGGLVVAAMHGQAFPGAQALEVGAQVAA
jgi:heme exporter protein A